MPEIELLDKSYLLSASLIAKDGTNMLEYELDELHSAWQRRSVLSYNTRSRLVAGHRHGSLLPQVGKFYANNQNEVFLVNEEDRTCQLKSQELVDIVISLNVVNIVKSGQQWQQAPSAAHVIGLTRLLSFINANRDKFAPVNTARSISYRAELPGDFWLVVIYSNVDGDNLANGLPRSMIVANTKNDNLYMFEMRRFVPIPADQPYFGRPGRANLLIGQDHSDADETATFELFAIERSFGCSKDFDATSERDVNPFLVGGLSESRFSFVAKAMMFGETMQMTVGYEPAMSMLRVVRVSDSLTRSVDILADYRNDRSYHRLRRHSSRRQDDVVFDKVLQTDDELTCVVSKLGDSNRDNPSMLRKYPNLPSLGKLLFGTEKLFYLGLARLRGIEVRVYEAYNCEWPVWMVQPTIYIDERSKYSSKSGSLNVRRHSGPSSNLNGLALNCVFYFNKIENAIHIEAEILESNLMLVEVFKIDKNNQVLELIPIHIYDFSWQLNTLAPNNQRWQDFFALGDDCVAGASQTEPNTSEGLIGGSDSPYATISMLLEIPAYSRQNIDWLREPARRNLALLRGGQELFMPPILLYDLESRLELAGKTSKNVTTSNLIASSQMLAVTMKAAERIQDIVGLVFFGMAMFKKGQFSTETFFVIRAFSLQSCSMLVAHRRVDSTLFAYQPITSLCFLPKDTTLTLETKSSAEQLFRFTPDGKLEVYQVKHRANLMMAIKSTATTLAQHRNRLVTVKRVPLIDPMTLVAAAMTSPEKLSKTCARHLPILTEVVPEMRHFEMVFSKQRNVLDDLNDKEKPSIDLNKFYGIGLTVADTKHNKLILGAKSELDGNVVQAEPSELEQSLNAMTFEQCQTACLGDFDCRSFSTCIHNGEIECITSRVAFNEPSLARQLMLLIRNKHKNIGSIHQVAIEQNQDVISVKKHPTCELHNKIYTDLFVSGEKFASSLVWRVLRPVASVEQCAKLCFEWTIDQMRRRSKVTVQNSTNELDSNLNKICDYFFYADRIDVVEQAEESGDSNIPLKLLLEHSDSGYCVFDKQLDETDDVLGSIEVKPEAFKDVSKVKFPVRDYRFEHKFLFGQHFDWSLVEYRKTPEEEKAYEMLLSGHGNKKDLAEALEKMQPLVDRGENFGFYRSAVDSNECARACLELNRNIWPACRSFDYFEVHIPGARYQEHYCAFNTITLRQAIRSKGSDLVRGHSNHRRVEALSVSHVRAWHFEPKPGLVTDSFDAIYNVAKTHELVHDLDIDHTSGYRGYHPGHLMLFCVVLAALVLGMTGGVKLALLTARHNLKRNDADLFMNIVEREEHEQGPS